MRPILAVALCGCLAMPVRAEPGPVVDWLMNEPASLFDIGIYKLFLRVNDVKKGFSNIFGDTSVIVDYDWNKNRIRIIGWLLPNTNSEQISDPTIIKRMCSTFFEEIRFAAGVNPETGKLFPYQGNASAFSWLFAHTEYRRDTEPKNYQARLDEIFEIEFKHPASRFLGSGKGPRTQCSGSLLDTGFSVKEDVKE